MIRVTPGYSVGVLHNPTQNRLITDLIITSQFVHFSIIEIQNIVMFV